MKCWNVSWNVSNAKQTNKEYHNFQLTQMQFSMIDTLSETVLSYLTILIYQINWPAVRVI